MNFKMNKSTRIAQILTFSTLTACFLSTSAFAIVLDPYNFTSANKFQISTNSTSSAVQDFGGAIGGTRSIQIEKLSGTSTFDVAGNPAGPGSPSSLTFGTTGTATGTALIAYDGDNVLGLNNFRGLGGVNLLSGNATELDFEIFYDHNNLRPPGKLVFTFYETADKWSQGVFTLNQEYLTLAPVSFAFSSFTTFGSGGAANLSNIGAFSMLYDATNVPASDFIISNLRTNGSNISPVPEPATMGLLASGLLGGIAARKKKAI